MRSQITNTSANLNELDLTYRAALKKLELTADKAAQLQKELLKLDVPRNDPENTELLPW